MNILITGGAGYIGSHCVRQLLQANHKVVVLDNLCHGYQAALKAASFGLKSQPIFIQASLADAALVTSVLKQNSIDTVMHFAGFIEVGESVLNPGKYYLNNFSHSITLLECMAATGVSRLVFSSTAAVYGPPEVTPIQENHPLQPMNPYGKSKMMTEMAIQDFATTFGIRFVFLRYFNVAGASPDARLGESHQPESHLIPRVLAVAGGKATEVEIYGTDYATPDGTCIRDYVHVVDLVSAHLLAAEHLATRKAGQGEIYNLGSEKGFSVREVIQTCIEVSGRPIPTVIKPRRPGDPPVLIASSEKIRRDLGWTRQYPDLRTIVTHAWNWHQAHPEGFQTSLNG